MSNNPLIFHTQHHADSLNLLQYSTAYFNPYEVKHRKRTSRAQLTVLEATFKQNNKPSSAVKKHLAAQLDMPIRNVQVWFQNRRAKDKNLALKARLKAEQQATSASAIAGPDGAGEGFKATDKEESPSDDEDDDDEQKSPKTPTTSSGSPSASMLTPPANNALRRGSAPSLGVSSLPTAAGSSTSGSGPRNSPPNAARSASDSVPPTTYGQRMPSLEVPNAAILARRKSLPAFHPALQQKTFGGPSGSRVPSLPTVSDSQSSNFQTSPPESGHGGVYRSASQSKLSVNNPYPATTTRSNLSYRPGSTPGMGVFRIPANPNPLPTATAWSAPAPQPDSTTTTSTSTTNNEDAAAAPNANANGGLITGRPYAFPPRPFADIPQTGPLPSKDFRFGDSGSSSATGSGNVNVMGAPFRDSPPSGAEEDDPRGFGIQTHRFSSFASDLSIESDATGTTATTATSSTGYSPLNNMALSAAQATHASMMPFRARYSIAASSGYPQDMTGGLGSSISYGFGNNNLSVGGFPAPTGLGNRMHYPQKFDPDARRASCPAHFIEDMGLLSVDRPTNTPSTLGVGVGVSPFGIRRSSSGVGLVGRSPLGLADPVLESSVDGTGATEDEAPLTAVAGEYSGGASIFSTGNYSMGASGPGSSAASSSGDPGSRQATTSPQVQFNSVVGAFQQSHQQPFEASLADPSANGPLFMANFTQEPTYDTSSFGSYANDALGSADLYSQSNASYASFGHGQFDATASTQFDTTYGQQQVDDVKPSESFSSFLHAPAPTLASTSTTASSLAGAVQYSGGSGNDQDGGFW